MKLLIAGDPSGVHTYSLIKKGYNKDQIYVWEDSTKGKHCVKLYGVNNITNNLEDLNHMRFTMSIGNPPYGVGGNTAIKFLNKLYDLTDDIRLVLPLSIRKPTLQNRINPYLKCVEDKDLPDNTFPGSIKAVYQRWIKSDTPRDKIKMYNYHPDFEFLKYEDRFNADLFIGIKGAGPAGRVKTSNFIHYADTGHHLIRCNEEVKNRLISLEPYFREEAFKVNGPPSLGKHDLITIYKKYFE